MMNVAKFHELLESGKKSFCKFVLYMFWFAKAKALVNGLGLGSLEALAVALVSAAKALRPQPWS